MDMLGEFTYREILEQPACWKRILAERGDSSFFFAPDSFDELLFLGCGSSLHLAQTGASLFGALIRTQALPASEVFLFPESFARGERRIGVVAFSRTGETTEVLRALETLRALRAHGALEASFLGLTCTPESSLVRACDRTVILPVSESSLVTTQAYTATLLVLARWAEQWGMELEIERVAGLAMQAMLQASSASRLVADEALSHFVFLGSGSLFSLAQEGALKMMEMAGESAASAFRALEFRHGPKAAVSSQTLVTLLVSEAGADYERSLHAELKALGARTLVLVGDEASSFPEADHVVAVGAAADMHRAILYAPTLQLLAFQRAMRNGTNPDAPLHLSRSVRI